MKTIVFLWGLPGSGKSTYACKNSAGRWKAEDGIVDFDKYCSPKWREANDPISRTISDCARILESHDYAFVDGLIVTNAAARAVIGPIRKSFPEVAMKLVVWNPDRELCLFNDNGRREVSSELTITKHAFEEPSDELISELQLSIERQVVVSKPAWRVWAHANGLGDQSSFVGESWSLGGTSWNCGDDDDRIIEPDDPASTFTKFDELMERACPQITFLQYKRAYAASVSTFDYDDKDYYSREERRRFQCDVQELYNSLMEIGLIPKTP